MIGVYSIGVGFGLVPKIALRAFGGPAWAPFYYATARRPGAAEGVQQSHDLRHRCPRADDCGACRGCAEICSPSLPRGLSVAAEPFVAWTAVGVFFYGIYLLTSIGLNITKQTQFYPVSTAIGAAANLGLNFLLIPHYGIVGAAWANAAAYALRTL